MTRLRRTLACSCAALAALAPAALAAAPRTLPALPASGIVVQRAHGVVLVGADGRTVATVAGLTGPYSGSTYALEGLAEAVPGTILLADASRRAYRLDTAASRIVPLAQLRVPVAGGATVSVQQVPQPKPYMPKLVVHVERGGTALVPPDQGIVVVGGRLVVLPSSVLDLATGTRWHVPTGATLAGGGEACQPAGVAGRLLVAVCVRAPAANPVVQVVAFAPGGGRRALSAPFRWQFGAEAAGLSPDGRYVGMTLAVGCGAPFGAVAPTRGGRARLLSGELVSALGRTAVPNSSFLGWAADGRALAEIVRPTDCEHSPRTGVYLVAPATGARTLVLPTGAGTWVQAWGPLSR